MLGPEHVATAIAAALRTHVPQRAPALAARLGVTADAVPVPRAPDPQLAGDLGAYFTEDRARIDEDLPALITTVRRVRQTRRVDPAWDAPDGPADVFVLRYVVRVLGFAEGEDYADTSRRRQRLALLTRETLLSAPLADELSVDSETLIEDYSDVGATEQGRYLAGFWLESDVVCEETLTVSTLGVVQTPEATVVRHPAL